MAAYFVLRAGDCDYGDNGSLEPDQQLVRALGQSFCHGICGRACTLRRCDHELRRTDGGTVEREYQPLPFNSNAFLSGQGRLCLRMDGQGEPQRGAASRAAGLNRGDCRSHSAGHLCPQERFPHALWDCSGRNAFRVAGDSQHTSSFSQSHHERAAGEFAHATAGPPIFYRGRDSLTSCDLAYNLPG